MAKKTNNRKRGGATLNIPVGLQWVSSVSDSSEEAQSTSLLSLSSFRFFFIEPFSSLYSVYLPARYDSCSSISEANFRSLNRRYTFIRFFKLVNVSPWFMFTTPNTSQHIATGWPNARNLLRPTVLRYHDMLRWHVAIVWPGLYNTTR